MSAKFLLALLPLASMVAGHGLVISPKPRAPGPAMQKACGQQVFNNQQADGAGNVQGELQIAKGQNDFDAEACHIWLCKGYQFEDNKDNVQQFTAGQTVPIKVDIRAPHTGVANVSIVDTKSQSLISSELISWDDYASTAHGVKPGDKDFSIKIPTNLGSKCNTAGECVVQWYWFAKDIDQTYESCIDFTLAGSGSGSDSGSDSDSGSPAPTASTSSAAQGTPKPTTLATSVRSNAAATQAPNALAAEIAAAFPSSVLAMELPAKPTGAGLIPETELPAGTTVQDLVNWFADRVAGLVKN